MTPDESDRSGAGDPATGLIDVDDVPGVAATMPDLDLDLDPDPDPDPDPNAAAAPDAPEVEGAPDGAGEGPAAAELVPDVEQLERERARLIDLLVYAWDRARSPGVWERLTTGLADVGVTVLRPDREPFDPNRHEVGGVETTDDDALVDTVAETEVAGFSDRGRVLREPIVVVYRRSV